MSFGKPNRPHFMNKILTIVRTCLLILCFSSALFAEESNPTPPPPPPAGKSLTSSWGGRLKQGGPVGLIQIALSIFGAGFVFERFYHLRRKNLAPAGLADETRKLWQEGRFDELEKLGETNPSALAHIISFIAKNRHSPMVEVSAVCGDMASRDIENHNQRAYPLGIVATLAPLLGLLGMIVGMISTFETVAFAGSLGDASQLAGGISEALVTTGLGLAVAIPFLALYHFFKHRTAGFGVMLEEDVTNLLSEWLMAKPSK